MISAGDIPAKFVGYTLALIIVPYTGTKTPYSDWRLLHAGIAAFFLAILRSGKHEAHKHNRSATTATNTTTKEDQQAGIEYRYQHLHPPHRADIADHFMLCDIVQLRLVW